MNPTVKSFSVGFIYQLGNFFVTDFDFNHFDFLLETLSKKDIFSRNLITELFNDVQHLRQVYDVFPMKKGDGADFSRLEGLQQKDKFMEIVFGKSGEIGKVELREEREMIFGQFIQYGQRPSGWLAVFV